MSVQIRYMGAKHDLAPIVANLIAELSDGPCLDLFAGMCSIAGAIAPSDRETWCNDVQKYAALVSEALIASTIFPVSSEKAVDCLLISYTENLDALNDRFAADLTAEYVALEKDSYKKYLALTDSWCHVGNDHKRSTEASRLRLKPNSFPYRMVTLTYAYGYFGLRQSIELDSIKFSIDQAQFNGRLTKGEALWCNVALLQTASHLSNAPGHFAEFLHPNNETNYKRIRQVRKRSAWGQFLTELKRITPYGTTSWRARNKVFCEDASNLAEMLLHGHMRPRITYADPPYSRAQYSRYYHVMESLVEYDYPQVKGAGRYREDRFITPFSKSATVSDAFDELVEGTAKLGSDLILSYPSNGLFFKVGEDLISMLEDRFRSIQVFVVNHQHSTLGGAPGRRQSDVEEMIFVAKVPR